MPQPVERLYAPLAAYLTAQAAAGVRRVTLPFVTLEALLRRPLPASARAGRTWWRARGHNPQAWYGWVRVGWRVAAVDLAAETATFARGAAAPEAGNVTEVTEEAEERMTRERLERLVVVLLLAGGVALLTFALFAYRLGLSNQATFGPKKLLAAVAGVAAIGVGVIVLWQRAAAADIEESADREDASTDAEVGH